MARYIDAEKAVEEARLSYCKDCNSYNGARCSACGFDDAMTYIEDAPTADVVEVVRCKNCKHKEKETNKWCKFWNKFCAYDDNYCKHGERRTDDELL